MFAIDSAFDYLIGMIHPIISFATLIFSAQLATAAVFGGNEFQNVIEENESARAIAISLLGNTWSNPEPGVVEVAPERLSGTLCPREPLSRDASLSYACTGFLVAPDLLVTAGHCSTNSGEAREETGMYCEAFSWLFDYRNGAGGESTPTRFPAENHYKCKRIIHAVREDHAPFRDYAVIQLDRPVKGRTPLRLSTTALDRNSKLHMLGHPLGTPLKSSLNGKILVDDPERGSFIAALTALQGNSGSPVLNERGEVVGILIGGTPSLGLIEVSKDDGTNRTCRALNRCDGNAANCDATDPDPSIFPGFQAFGSEIQRISPITRILASILNTESAPSVDVVVTDLTLARDRFREIPRPGNGEEKVPPQRTSDEFRAGLSAELRRGHRPVGYDRARIELFGNMALKQTSDGYAIHDIYCDRDYTARDFPTGQGPGPGKVPLAEVMNAEHTWPQSRFGGREKDAQKCDLHHLFPSDSQMNAVRGNHPFGEPVAELRGVKCPISRFGKDTNNRWVFEPPTHQRGDTARAIFYFSVRYDLAIDTNQEAILKRWHSMDPVTSEERTRNGVVERIQGNRNPFVDHPEFVDRISDF